MGIEIKDTNKYNKLVTMIKTTIYSNALLRLKRRGSVLLFLHDQRQRLFECPLGFLRWNANYVK